MTEKYILENVKYLEIDENYEGYEFSLYDKEQNLLDGGILENINIGKKDAIKEIMKMYGITKTIELITT